MAFNKMFVMIPLMLVTRKIDGEDPDIIFYIRCGYVCVQAIIIMLVVYIYMKASSTISADDEAAKKVVYVPPAPQPFADPNANTKFTETTFGKQMSTTARSLIGSTLFGIIITTGLHLYKGIIMGLAMQIVMGPLGLIENPLVKKFLMGNTERTFGEKHKEELKPEDEVVDGEGNIVPRNMLGKSDGEKSTKAIDSAAPKKKKTFETILLDTWDQGTNADIAPLLDALTKENINSRTAEYQWTPIMILSGLGAKNVTSGLRKMKALGADPELVDVEGWNALHWAGFHGSADAAKVLLDVSDFDGLKLGLHSVKDKEGKVPLDHAKAEKNGPAEKVIADAISASGDTALTKDSDEGLRRRKTTKA